MIGIFRGLMTTLSTAMRRPVTIQYPDVKHVLPVRERSFPVLLYDFEHDEPLCTGCNICVRNCPVDCMTAVMKDNPKYDTGESDKKKIVEKFWIDYARCMRCNICVEVCPFEAIAMDNTWAGHEHAVYDRLDLHYDIDDLLSGSKNGTLQQPFFPYDNLARLDAELEGNELPAESAQGARPEARKAAFERVEQGLPMGLKGEPPPDAKKPAAAAAAGAPGAAVAGVAEGGTDKGEFHSPSKQRARRMRAERRMKEVGGERGLAGAELDGMVEVAGKFGIAGLAADEAVEQALAGATPPEIGAAAPGAPAAAAAGTGAAIAVSDIWLPAGPKGDPMSLEKQRARRMRAERKAKEVGPERGLAGGDLDKMVETAGLFAMAGDNADDAVEKAIAGEALPDSVQQALAAAGGGGGGGAPGAPAATAATAPSDIWLPAGPKGDPMSVEKQRARRMRAERKAKEVGPERGLAGGDLDKMVENAGFFAMAGDNADDAVEKAVAGEALPDVVQQALAAAGASGGGPATSTNGAATAAPTEEFALPLGGKGEPNSPEKQRARRMRAERKAKEIIEQRGIAADQGEALLKRAGWLAMEGQATDEAIDNALKELGL